MNNIESSLLKAETIEDFSTAYFSYLFEVLKKLMKS